MIPGRRIVGALAAEDVGRILAEAPEPFDPASWEKRRSPALKRTEPPGPRRRWWNVFVLPFGLPGPGYTAAYGATRLVM